MWKITILFAVIILFLLGCDKGQEGKNVEYFYKEDGSLYAISFSKNNKNVKTVWFNSSNLASIVYNSENGIIGTNKYFSEEENIYLKGNYNYIDSIKVGDIFEYYSNSIIKSYSYYDSIGKKLYYREYNEYGALTKSEGRVMVNPGFIAHDSSIYLQFAMPPYCKTYIKYLEYDSEGNQVSDTIYAENERIIYYKTKTIENRLDFYVYLIDLYNKDTTLEKTRVRVPAVIELSHSQK